MRMHRFKYIPKPKPKMHIISGWNPGPERFKYHCAVCDSTIELEKKVPEIEVNKFFTDPARRFPCLKPGEPTPML